MKIIGFADFYISEWHADNYPKWISEASEALGLDYQVKYAWAEQDISPVSGLSTDEWCAKMGVTRCATLKELCEVCDHVIVLAPSNPEKHLGYAEEVLKYGKRTYIDKTFAPDFAISEKIFELGKAGNTSFFSTSALRYASELKNVGNAQKLIITGGGRYFEEYLIHIVEMAVVLLGTGFSRVKTETVGEQRICRCQCADGREAVLIFSPALGYSITAEYEGGKFRHFDVTSSFFLDLIKDILRFFETGIQPFDPEETRAVMRVRDGLLTAEKQDGVWFDI